MDGRVIAFEGIDGSGKGVQIREIAGRLNGLGRKVLVQDFPVYSGFLEKRSGGCCPENRMCGRMWWIPDP